MRFVCQLLVLLGSCLLSGGILLSAETKQPSEEELSAVREVQGFLQSQKLDEAEKELTRQLVEFPTSPRVHALHMNFAYAYRRENQHDDAFRHMQKLVAFYLTSSEEQPELYNKLANSLAAMSSYSQVADKVDEAKAQFTDVIETLESRHTKHAEDEKVLGAVHDVRLRGIDFLIAIEAYDLADQHLEDELKLAQAEYKEKADSPAYILRLSNALRARVVLRDALGDPRLEDARVRQLAFLKSKATQHKENLDVVTAYLEAHLGAVSALAGSNPKRAAEILNETRTFVKALDRTDREIEQKALIAESSFAYLQELIASGRKHTQLVGSEASPLDVVAWVNGTALKPEDLKGKVILLDFWSVWCVPCLEAFPHLNRWEAKYSERGLKTIGITRFYNYVWDDEKEQPAKELDREVPQNEELELLEKFAKQQELLYPIAVTTPGSEYQAKFAVRGIPQTVLIDRNGKIRLIRVGTGPTFVREIEEMLETLLAEETLKTTSKEADNLSPTAKKSTDSPEKKTD